MRALRKWLHAFVNSEDGPTPAQYALMLCLIGVACFAGIRSLGTASNSQVNSASTMMQNAGS